MGHPVSNDTTPVRKANPHIPSRRGIQDGDAPPLEKHTLIRRGGARSEHVDVSRRFGRSAHIDLPFAKGLHQPEMTGYITRAAKVYSWAL